MIIEANGIPFLLNYLITIIVSIVVALVLGLPLLPDKPKRFSWVNSAIYPTPIIALGLLAILFALKIVWIYNGLVLAIIIGILSALFVKYLFYYVFPNPPGVNEGDKNSLEEDNAWI